MIGVADHMVLLWVLLPLAVLVSGMAPSMISFAAGQAAFTLVVIILFNIIQPIGWKVGLTRIEDVAIGCGVSIVVGFLFWPRGATAALGTRPLDRVRGQLRLPGRRGRAADHDESARGHRSQPAGIAPGLPASRRRLPPVLRRTGGQGGVGGDHLAALHGIEPAPSGRLHPGHAPRPASRSRANPRSSPWPSPRRSCATPTRPATVGTRSSPTCSPTGATSWTSHRRTARCSTMSCGRPSRTSRTSSGADRVQTTLQMLWADELLENQSQMQS